jgi:hypothetical protein
MKRKRVVSWIIGVIAVLMLAGVGIAASLRIYRLLFDVERTTTISHDFVISSDWQRVSFTIPIRAERQVQRLDLKFDRPLAAFHPLRSFLEGQALAPEVVLLDDLGSSFECDFAGSNEMMVSFAPIKELPRDRNFVAINVRAKMEFHIKQMEWRYFNQRDKK